MKANEIIVAIDAGHGSNTAGKRTPDGYREHWINVKCANYFDIAMKRCGFRTLKIAWDDTDATNDADVALSTRQKQIKNAKCKISVSWHANAHGNGTTYTSGRGIETLIHNNSTKAKDSKTLANKVQSYLIKGTEQVNRGVKTQNLAMCNCVAMGTDAAILIEVGFMTNEYESKLLKTDAFCLECAEEAAQGVCNYYGITYISPVVENTNSTYTVQSGDTLYGISKKTGVNWKTIADLNGIVSPYTLNVGQVLILEEGASSNTSTPVVETPVVVVEVPLTVAQSKLDIQRFLNKYYGDEIKQVNGALLVEDGKIGNLSKLAIGVAIQVELNKLGAKVDVDGKIGSASDAAFDKCVGVLKKGSKNIFVTLWQCILVAYNLDPNGIDGTFGNGCVTATNTLFGKLGLVKDSSVSGADINAIL